MKKQALSGNLLVSIAALLWGTSFVAIEWGFRESEIDPLVYVFLRFSIATLMFLPFAFWKLERKSTLLKNKGIILIGLFNALAFMLQFLGQQFTETTSAGKASLFVNIYAITVPLLAPLILPEKYTWRVILSAALGFSGAFFVTTNLDLANITGGTLVGDLLTLGSGGAWTLYILASKKILENDKSISGLDAFFGTLIWTTIFLTIAAPFAFINNSWNDIIIQFNWQVIVSIIYLALVCTVGAFALYMIGLKKAEAGESVVFMFLEVIIAFLLGWAFFGTVPKTWESVGAAMIVIAIMLVSIKMKQKEERSFEKGDSGNNVGKNTTKIIQK
jgi:drug/metabolite transporter (DMT)-like permease